MTREQLKMADTLACICSHPTRLEMVRLLTAGPDYGASATMFHNAGMGPIQTLAYHLRALRGAKVVRVKSRKVGKRAAVETFFVLTPMGRGAYHAFVSARPLEEDEQRAQQAHRQAGVDQHEYVVGDSKCVICGAEQEG